MRTSEKAGPAESQAINLRDLWQIFLKRKWIVIAVASVIFITVGTISYLTTPTYTAKGQILIEREPNILSFQDMLQIEPLSDDYFQTQYQLLQSRSLAGDTVDRAKLMENKTIVGDVVKARPGSGPDAPDPLLRRKLGSWVLGHLSIQPLRRTRLINLSFSYRDPKLAADILNAVIDSYIEMNIERKFQASSQATDFLAGQIAAIQKEIEAKERQLQEYGQSKDIVSMTDSENTVVTQLAQLNNALTAARIERINKETYYNEIRNAGPDNIPSAMITPVVQRQADEYNRLKGEFSKVSETYQPAMKIYKDTQAALEAAKKVLEDEARSQIARANTEYQAALRYEQGLAYQVEEQKKKTFVQSGNAIQYNTLLNEIQNAKSLKDTLMTRKSEADVSSRLKGLGASNISIVDRAEIPLTPSAPRTARNAALALLVGLFLGLALALLYENLDVTIKDAEDVQRYAGVPTLGMVPLFPQDGSGRRAGPVDERSALGEKAAVIWSTIGQKRPDKNGGPVTDLHVQFAPDSTFAEQYRTIRTALFYSLREKDLKALAVTSPLPQDGKTATVCNLATSLAQAGKRVVIIDADLRKPRLHAVFRIKNLNGLTKYLMDDLPLTDLIRATPIPTLYLINAGPQPPDPTELLGSEKMARLIAELKNDFDFVLIDTPPILAVSDALVVGSRVDGAILVVRRGQTPRDALKRSAEKLEVHKIKTLGVVINAVRMRDLDEYHVSSYYGHGKRTDG